MTEGKGTPKPHSVISNTSSSNDNGGESSATLAVSGLVIALALVSVALRFYVRIITKAGLWWDDQLVLAAVVFTLLTAVLLLWGKIKFPLSEAIEISKHGSEELNCHCVQAIQ